MLQQLTEIKTGKVIQEHDDITALPVFGGQWGDEKQFVWKPAPKVRLVELARAEAEGRIKGEYQTALDAGVTYSGAVYQSDAKSISTLAEVLTAISNGWPLPAGFAWIDTVNKPHPADIVFLKGLSTALANHKAVLFARLQIAKAAINAAKTVTAVNKVVL